MTAIGHVFGWLGRKALLYVVIVVAILASAFVLPWIKAELTGPRIHLDRAARLDAVASNLEASRADAQRRLSNAAKVAQRKSVAELDKAIAGAKNKKAEAESRRRSVLAKANSLRTIDTDALLTDGRNELEIKLRDGEINGLIATRDQLAKRNALDALTADVRKEIDRVNGSLIGVQRAQAACRQATQKLTAFERRFLVRVTLGRYDRVEHDNLQKVQSDKCADLDRREKAYRLRRGAAEALQRQRNNALNVYRSSRGWANNHINSVTSDLEEASAAERTTAEGSWRAKISLWAERIKLVEVLRTAAVVLALIIASPFLIRLFCYFVLAPAAMRRPAIRLSVPGGAGVAIPPADRSATSVAVRLATGEELLVRQDYLQTTSHAGAKATQWFLDRRHPFTSIAAGLTFLTRIRGEGEVTTVSAVRDPFAEVTIVNLPDGASCVLHPRALAGVAQPIGRPLRVETKWRLTSLSAWLTLQLRYVVFHGPARLVVKGGRGVRVERAERGRIFGQDQLVGFSADLSYSVTRTETFWPYLLGRETLLKDRVEAGKGVLIVEEAPLTGRRGEVRRGIEGMIDAGMKVFGV